MAKLLSEVAELTEIKKAFPPIQGEGHLGVLSSSVGDKSNVLFMQRVPIDGARDEKTKEILCFGFKEEREKEVPRE